MACLYIYLSMSSLQLKGTLMELSRREGAPKTHEKSPVGDFWITHEQPWSGSVLLP